MTTYSTFRQCLRSAGLVKEVAAVALAAVIMTGPLSASAAQSVRTTPAVTQQTRTLSSGPAQVGGPAVPIVAVLSLSGPYASVGSEERIAISVAIDVANRQGGIDGHPIRLLTYDDHSHPEDAAADAREIVSHGRPAAVVGGSYEGTCTAMRPVFARAGVVQYCLSGSHKASDLYFATFPSSARLFGDLPAAWMRAMGFRRAAIIASSDPAGEYYARSMRAAAKGDNVEVSADVAVNGDEPRTIASVIASRPDVIFIGATTFGSKAILSELRRRRSSIPVWLVSANATLTAARAISNDLPPGTVYTSGLKLQVADELNNQDPQKDLLLRFIGSYEHASHGEPPDAFAAVAADAMEFLVAALRALHGYGGPVLAHALESTPRSPGLYSWYRFSAVRHVGAELPQVILVITPQGTFRFAGTVLDQEVPDAAERNGDDD